MSSIDQRIVEMQFDNKQFEEGVSTSIKSLNALKKGLDLDASAKSIKNLGDTTKNLSFDRLASSVEKISSRFTTLGIIGVTALQRITHAAMNAGERLLSAITIDPVRSGLREYETQIDAIQTILSNTRSQGKNLDDVNRTLDELNRYADKTIYNFTEMTRNIGTFTAAGVELETSTAAIKGLSNLAAISGASSQKASVAMYQLSQALASGTIRLMDWNSIVNAGMGGEVFQNALKETARVHGINIDKMIKKEGSFRETLQNGWLTSEIMIETLQKFTGDLTKEQIRSLGYTEKQAEEILALGKDANDAATKVKTFSQLIDTLKEALGSGWTQSWEYIIGDFEEARALWTSVSDAIGEIINRNAESRNALLKGWHDAGGRDDLIQGLTDTFGALYSIVVAVGDAIKEIFPPVTVDTLLKMSRRVKEFGENLKQIFHYSDKQIGYSLKVRYETTPEPFVEKLKKGMSGDKVKELQKRLTELGYDVGPAGADGIFGSKTLEGLKAFQKQYGLTIDGVYGQKTHEKLIEALGLDEKKTPVLETTANFVRNFSDALEKLKRAAKGVFSIFHIGWQGLKFLGNTIGHILQLLSPVGNALLTIAAYAGDFFTELDKGIENSGIFSDWFGKITDFLKPFGEELGKAGGAILRFFGFGDEANEAQKDIRTFPKLWGEITKGVRNLEVWDRLKNAFDRLKTAFSGIMPVFKKIYSDIKQQFGDKFSSLFDAAAQKIPYFIGKFGEAFESLLDFTASIVGKIPDAIAAVKDFFGGLWDEIKNFDGIQNGLAHVKNFLSEFWNSIVEFFSGGSGTQADAVEKGVEECEEEFKNLLSVGDWLKNVWEKIKAGITWVADGINSTFESLGGMKGIIELASRALSFLTGVEFVKLIRQFGKATKEISSAVANLAGVEIVKAVHSFSGIAKNTSSLIDNVGDTVKLFNERIKGENKNNNFKAFAEIIKGMAIAIGVIAVAIFALGQMNPDILKQGAIAVGGIMASLLVMMGVMGILSKKLPITPIATKGFLGLAISIGALTLVMKMIAGMSIGEYVKGLLGLAIVMTLLQKFVAHLNTSGKAQVQMKGFFGLALALGVLVGVMKLICGMSIVEYIKGLIGLAGILVLLRTFSQNVSRFGNANVKMKGFFVLAASVRLLMGVMKTVAEMSIGAYVGGILGLTGIMVLLIALAKIMNKVGGLSGNVKFGEVIAMTAAIGILATAMLVIGKAEPGTILKGLMGLIGICAGLSLLMYSLKSINTKSGIGMLIGCIGLVGVIAAFSYAMKNIKDIDAEKLTGFVVGLTSLMIGFSVFMRIAGRVRLGGVFNAFLSILAISGAIGLVIAAFAGLSKIPGFSEFMNSGAKLIGEVFGNLVGIGFGVFMRLAGSVKLSGVLNAFLSILAVAGAIGLVIAAFAGLSKIPGFSEFMNSGAESIGEVFGTLVGSFEAAKLTAMTKGLSAAANADIDQNGLNKTLACAQMIADFAKGLPPKGIGKQIADFFFGTDLEQFSLGIYAFGNATKAFATNIEGLSIDQAEVDSAIDAAKAILNLAEAIEPLTVGEALTSIILGGTPFEKFSGEMVVFSNSISEVSENLSNLPPELEKNVSAAVSAAKQIQALAKEVGALTIEEAVGEWINSGKSKFEDFCNEMPLFAASMLKVGLSLIFIPPNLEKNVSAAVSAAEQIQKLANEVGKITIEEAAGELINGGKSKFEDFCNDMGTFGESVGTLSDNIKDLNDTQITADVDAATAAAIAVGKFMESIAGLDIEVDQNGFVTWFSGESKIDTLLSKIPIFGEKLKAASTSLDGLSGTAFEDDIRLALDAVERLAKLFTFSYLSDGSYDSFDSYALDSVIESIKTVGEKVKDFSQSTADIDTSRFTVFMDAIDAIIRSLVSATQGDPDAAMTNLETYLNHLQTLLSGEGETKLDTANFLNGLDDKAIVERLTAFTSSVGTALDSSTQVISGYADAFSGSGATLASALNSGMGSQNAEDSETSGAVSICESALAAISGYRSKFAAAGFNMGLGLRDGLKHSTGLATIAAKGVAQAMLQAAKNSLGIKSPSREFEKLGMYSDRGLARGLKKYAKVVTRSSSSLGDSALDAAKGSLTTLSGLIGEDMDVDPVIRPVVDLSDVSSASRGIHNMLSHSGTLTVGASTSLADAGARGIARAKARQNGGTENRSEVNNANDSSISFNGNSFYIRSENDIHRLSSEIAALTRQQQRSMGST